MEYYKKVKINWFQSNYMRKSGFNISKHYKYKSQQYYFINNIALYDFSADREGESFSSSVFYHIISRADPMWKMKESRWDAMGRVSNIYPQKQLNQNNVKLK